MNLNFFDGSMAANAAIVLTGCDESADHALRWDSGPSRHGAGASLVTSH